MRKANCIHLEKEPDILIDIRFQFVVINVLPVYLLENINVFNNIHNLQIISIQIIEFLAMYVDCNVRISYHIVELSSVMNNE